jgi:hypothetical protein
MKTLFKGSCPPAKRNFSLHATCGTYQAPTAQVESPVSLTCPDGLILSRIERQMRQILFGSFVATSPQVCGGPERRASHKPYVVREPRSLEFYFGHRMDSFGQPRAPGCSKKGPRRIGSASYYYHPPLDWIDWIVVFGRLDNPEVIPFAIHLLVWATDRVPRSLVRMR